MLLTELSILSTPFLLGKSIDGLIAGNWYWIVLLGISYFLSNFFNYKRMVYDTKVYNTIYNDIPYKIEFFSKIKFVELKNLSQLLESEFNIYFNIEDKNYAMNQYFTKSSILAAMELNFADIWGELKKIIDK